MASLATGVSFSSFTKALKYRESYYLGGFSFSHKNITPLNIDKEKALEDRMKIYKNVKKNITINIELYNYKTKEIISFNNRNEVAKYLNTDKKNVRWALGYVEKNKKTQLLNGYGIRRTNQKIPWYPYNKIEILNSKLGYRLDSPVYVLSVEGKKDELIHGFLKPLKITNLSRDTFKCKVIKSITSYEFILNSLKAKIKKYR